MPRNSSGIFSLLPGTAAAAGEVIEAEKYNARDEDIASALTASLPRDGSAGMTSDLPMGSNKITGLADATAATDAVNRRVAFPTVLARTTAYTVLSTDRARTITADTSSAGFNITLPTLDSGDSGWFVKVMKVTAGTNAAFVVPPSSTINGFAKIRVDRPYVEYTFLWTGTAFIRLNPGEEPAGVVLPYDGGTVPHGYALAYGQAISRTDYPELFAAWGTTHGAGDESTTFNAPDHRGRVSVGKDDMGGSAASRVTTAGSGVDGATLGAAGGAQTQALTAAQLAAHGHTISGTTNDPGDHGHPYRLSRQSGGASPSSGAGAIVTDNTDTVGTVGPNAGTASNSVGEQIGGGGAHTHTVTGTAADTGDGDAHNNVQPSIVSNKIFRLC